MGQKFFISFNSADQTKAHWIAWTLKEAGHEVAVHDWELPGRRQRAVAWADRLIAVISPDYLPARYSPMEWSSQIWNDPDGTKGSVIPVIVRPTTRLPRLLNGLSRIDLTNCSEAEAKRRLIKGVDMPAPPQRKPAFETVQGEAPDSQHAGPADKPTFIPVKVDDGVPRWLRLSAAIATVAAAVIAALAFFLGGPSQRKCTTINGGMTVCGNYLDQRSPASSNSTTGPQSPIIKDAQSDVNIQYGSPPGSTSK
jgi:hypothetical protein